MSTWTDDDRPRLRPVQITPAGEGDEGVSYVITDAQQLSSGALTVSPPVVFILSLLDGSRTVRQVREEFQQQVGQPLENDTLDRVLHHLHTSLLLHGESFEAFYAGLSGEYASLSARSIRTPEIYGDLDQLRAGFDAMLSEHVADPPTFKIAGLIAPHLDYARGAKCYGQAYGLLKHHDPPKRVVILGTNHFGRSTAVCATGKDFETPLGRVKCDVDFLECLESRCGNLRQFEMDHAREHSVELQVLWLQHLLGSDSFKMVGVLCPDPCGPTGTSPRDGVGVDLDVFNRELRDLLVEDELDTLVIAGADLSHIGTFFGEDRPLSVEFLREVLAVDEGVLQAVANLSPQELRRRVADDGNSTNICSIGCIYSLLEVLKPNRVQFLTYHQAVTWEMDNCVTSAACAFGRD